MLEIRETQVKFTSIFYILSKKYAKIYYMESSTQKQTLKNVSILSS